MFRIEVKFKGQDWEYFAHRKTLRGARGLAWSLTNYSGDFDSARVLDHSGRTVARMRRGSKDPYGGF